MAGTRWQPLLSSISSACVNDAQLPPPHVRDEVNCFPHNQFVMHLVTQVNDQAISALFSMPPCVVYVTCFKQAAIFELFLTLLVMTLASCFRPHDNK